MSNRVLISFSAVQIYDLSYIHLFTTVLPVYCSLVLFDMFKFAKSLPLYSKLKTANSTGSETGSNCIAAMF